MKIVKYFFIFIGVLLLTLVAIGIFKTDFKSQASVVIDAPKKQVFAVYHSPLLYKQWMSNFHSIEQLEGQPNEIGNKHRLTFTAATEEVTTLDQTLAEIVSGERIVYHYDNQWLKGTSTTQFSTVDNDQTKVDLTLEYSGKGIVQNALLFLMSSSVDKGHQHNLEQLKKLIESSSPDELNGD
ncbi:SRPBCC family protein [Kangiella shandongensis]|uniref:SRPBCC family protein n=1 Tax=Kangiella shandongensis TaxID=2763258 RepID=UPI001CBB9007|nr:SRPBCC family protein [Kangiella shandongensis]